MALSVDVEADPDVLTGLVPRPCMARPDQDGHRVPRRPGVQNPATATPSCRDILETCPSWPRSAFTALIATAFSPPCGRPECSRCSTSASGGGCAGPSTPGLTLGDCRLRSRRPPLHTSTTES